LILYKNFQKGEKKPFFDKKKILSTKKGEKQEKGFNRTCFKKEDK